jgi:hypothetical protein
METVKEKRITEEVQIKADKIRASLSRCRSRLIKADDEGKPTERFTKEINRLKEELAKLTGHWQAEFTFTVGKRNEYGDYRCEGKYLNRVCQIVIHKDEDDGMWWTPDLSGRFHTLKEAKANVRDHIEFMWQVGNYANIEY